MKGFHILHAMRTLSFGDGRKVRLGVRMRMRYFGKNLDHRPLLGCWGMHAARTINRASTIFGGVHALPPLRPGPYRTLTNVWVCYVEVSGNINKRTTFPFIADTDLFCGEYRTVLAWVKVTILLGRPCFSFSEPVGYAYIRYLLRGKEYTQAQLAKLLREKARIMRTNHVAADR